MKLFKYFLILQLYTLPAIAQEMAQEVKQITVSDYLHQAAARAKQEGRTANSLIDESSPYLLQHAYNPVNWYAWGDVAFEKARKENKPVFLSIGYSTCHWCHVMAHESFENKQIADLLNRYFICIKVDREQRPDIDSVYMAATQLISGHGGWPMSVFLDHRLRPFHAATYYPPFSTDGRKGFHEILLTIHELWQQQPDMIDRVATNVTARISVMADDTSAGATLDADVYQQALMQIVDSYEADFGGFSVAPKFPRPGIFSFLTKLALTDKVVVKMGEDEKHQVSAQQMMQATLDAMASGGIYDQLGGGFHRYSVDQYWQVPHFEKMLYSQALMVLAYDEFYKVDAKPRYKQVIYDTLSFVSREMQSAGGGFYSALDADSEPADGKAGKKKEGAYYLWSEAELRTHLSAEEFDYVKQYFDIVDEGNIASDPQQEFTGLNILYVEEEFRGKKLTQQEVRWLMSAKKKLNKVRLQRPRPHLDDKVITAWNGMMISAFARTSQTFGDDALLQQATSTAGFIRRNLYDEKTGKLYRQYRVLQDKAAARAGATLSDYAWLITGLLDLYQASGDGDWLDWALQLQAMQDTIFLDEKSGAYFESAAGDNNLLFRSKSIYDDALPSANAVVLANLRKFSDLEARKTNRTSNQASNSKDLSSQADRLVSGFATAVNQSPSAAAMLLAVELGRVQSKAIEDGSKSPVLQ